MSVFSFIDEGIDIITDCYYIEAIIVKPTDNPTPPIVAEVVAKKYLNFTGCRESWVDFEQATAFSFSLSYLVIKRLMKANTNPEIQFVAVSVKQESFIRHITGG